MRVQFTIRDLLWLALVVALAVGWWLDALRHERMALYNQTYRATYSRLQADRDRLQDALDAANLKMLSLEDIIRFQQKDTAKATTELPNIFPTPPH